MISPELEAALQNLGLTRSAHSTTGALIFVFDNWSSARRAHMCARTVDGKGIGLHFQDFSYGNAEAPAFAVSTSNSDSEVFSDIKALVRIVTKSPFQTHEVSYADLPASRSNASLHATKIAPQPSPA